MITIALPRAAPKPVKVAKKPAMGRDNEREDYAEGGDWSDEEEDGPCLVDYPEGSIQQRLSEEVSSISRFPVRSPSRRVVVLYSFD